MQRLREATREHHARIEAQVDVMRPNLERSEYRALLERFHGFYAPLEPLLAARLHEEPGLEASFRERWKTEALSRDLRALGCVRGGRMPAGASDLPRLETTAAALGCLYVLEGATLGGQIISRHIGPLLGVDRQSGGAFFESYGDAVGSRWREFGQLLRERLQREAEIQDAICGASETFIKFERWLAVRKLGYD